MKKIALSILFSFTFAQFCFSSENIEKLLTGYLQNNIELKKLTSKYQNQIYTRDSVKINNGFDISLSTGTITYRGGDINTLEFSPDLTASFPSADNLKISGSASVELTDDKTPGQKEIYSKSISISADIFSGNIENTKINLIQADRLLLEAHRSLQNGFLTAEKKFYESLKTIYKIAADLQTQEKNLYEDQLDFEQIKAQGYATSSTKYRLAASEVLSSQHKVTEYQHKLIRETKIFAKKCGIEFDGTDAMDFLPETIPVVTPVHLKDFPKENYTKMESALWNANINRMKRNAQKDVNLSASAGYTFDNKLSSSNQSLEYGDTLDAGLNFNWNKTGLTASADVNIPVNSENSTPRYKFSLGFNPNQFRLKKLSQQQETQEIIQDQLSIEDAASEYETSIISQVTSLEDILWSKKQNEESYDLYTTIEADSKNYFEKGLIKQTEYRSAQVNKENARIQLLLNNLDLIIYNNETKLLFTRDSELYNQNENQ